MGKRDIITQRWLKYQIGGRCNQMNYHNITHDDMLNGDGLRVVLWVSGCSHNCNGCQNPQTHDIYSGIPFDDKALHEIFDLLDKDYICGLTLSGGDPLHENNLTEIYSLINDVRKKYGNSKDIWLYSGYTLEEIKTPFENLDAYFKLLDESKEKEYVEKITRFVIVNECDVFVDGLFVEKLKDNNYHWAGSSNQRILRKGRDY